MLERLAPPFSARRTFAKLAVQSLRRPGRASARLNRANIRDFRRFRAETIRCNICGHVGPLLFELPDLQQLRDHHIGVLRETLRCRGCASKMRDRTLAAALLQVMAERFGVEADDIDSLARHLPTDVRILDTDARSRIARRLESCPGVVRSLYYPDRPNGESLGEERCLNVDLEAMPFPDGHFDVVITSEVMEHVRHVDVAHREIARCLSPRGVYIFTLPYDPELAETWQLIDPVTDEPLVLPLHIHGDPGLRPTGIKSYRVFGRDIVDDMHAAGLETRFCPVDAPQTGIHDGDLFLAERRAT